MHLLSMNSGSILLALTHGDIGRLAEEVSSQIKSTMKTDYMVERFHPGKFKTWSFAKVATEEYWSSNRFWEDFSD